MEKSNIPPYKRKCENWISSFRDWVLPRSEAPEQYIFWSGIFCIASALKRKVKISREYLGGWECEPFMYIILVGPAGFRKTTTAKQGEILMEDIQEMPPAPTFVTQAAMFETLVASPDSAIRLLVEELGDIFLKGGVEMYEFLTSAYDGRKKLDQLTVGRGSRIVENPCINLIAGTTPSWIANKMPESAIGGGFASRVIWVYEDKLRARQMYYKHINAKYDFEKMQDNLISDLAHIAANIEGEMSIPDSVMEWMDENWYQKTHASIEEKAPAKLQGYYRRKPVHLHKLAMIVHFAKSDSMELSIDDFREALAILNGIERNLPRVFAGVGKNPYTLDIRSIIEYVSANKKVTMQEILREFQEVAQAITLEQLVQGCVRAGNLDIIFEGTGKDAKTFYMVSED